jgi:hypothetical protein
MPELHDLLADEASRVGIVAAPPFETLVGRSRRRRMKQVSAVVAVMVAVTAVIVVPNLLGSHRGAVVAAGRNGAPTEAGRRAIADQLANRLVNEVRLPADAKALPSEPPGTFVTLYYTQESSVQVVRYFTASGTVDAVLADAQAHPPKGLLSFGTDGGSSPGGISKGVSFSGLATHDYDVPTVSLEATTYGAGVALRVDATVTWRPLRTLAEQVPTSPSGATLIRTEMGSGAPRIVNLDRAGARELARLVNELDTRAPIVRMCPSLSVTTSVTFDVTAGQLVFTEYGCGDIGVTAAGVAQPALEADRELSGFFDRYFGTSPISSPPAAASPSPASSAGP